MEKLIAEVLEKKVDEPHRSIKLPETKIPEGSELNSRVFLSSTQCMGDDEGFLFAFGCES